MQTPIRGRRIHKFLNQELGLPISDSVFVQSENNLWVSYFLDFGRNFNRNRYETSEPHFIMLLRQWHRGNVDTFHSWQNAGIRTFFEKLDSHGEISNQIKLVELKYPPRNQKGFPDIGEHSLRLHFDGRPPNDLIIHIQHGEPPRNFSVDTRIFDNQRYEQWDLTEDSRNARIYPNPCENKSEQALRDEVIEYMGQQKKEFIVEINKNKHFGLKNITAIGVSADSCSQPCKVQLKKIELGNYSRHAVESSREYMRALGIAPRVYTSHGGFSLAQNFSFTFLKDPPRLGENPYSLSSEVLGRAQEKGGYAYIADLLSDLGVEYIWSYEQGWCWKDWRGEELENSYWDLPKKNSLKSLYPGFYIFSRTRGSNWCDLEKKDWGHPQLHSLLSDYAGIKDSNELVGISRRCAADQASNLGMLLAIGLAKIASEDNVEIVYYTHFGTPLDHKPGLDGKMFNPTTIGLFEDLMKHQYNFDNSISLDRRTWVPSKNVVARYRTNVENVRENLSVENNVVRISSYIDPVTEKTIPRDKFNPDDLAGITVYVEDADTARLFVDKMEVKHFVRNAQDQTGRESITIIDNSTPTPLIGLVPLNLKGEVLKRGVEWIHKYNQLPDLIVETEGRAEIEFSPQNLWLYNIQSLGFKYTKNKAEIKNVFFEIEMEDGRTISMLEEAKVASDVPALNASSGWRIPAGKESLESNVVLSTHSALWRSGTFEGKLGLPLGKVKRVRLGVLEAEVGDRLTDIMLRAYRPNGTAFLKRVPIAGKIEDAKGMGVVDVVVELKTEEGETVSTISDVDGYYFFSGIDRNQIVRLSGKKGCGYSENIHLEVLKPEVEVDISLKPDICDVN